MSIIFLLVSFLCSMAGLGGGSSYVGILALLDTPYEIIPFISLICNIIVVGGNLIHYASKNYLSFNLFFPIALGSVPMAFIGASIPINKQFFLTLLGITLILMGLKLLIENRWGQDSSMIRNSNPLIGLSIGSGLGFLAGLLGIGGGIFLAPILLLLRWGTPKEIAATASAFIFLNSSSGLLGHFLRHSEHFKVNNYYLLFLAVFIGGQLGSLLGTRKMSQKLVRGLIIALVFFTGCKTLIKVWIS